MRDETDRPRTEGDDQHTALPGPRHDRWPIGGILGNAEDDDVRLNGAELETRESCSASRLRDPGGIVVILTSLSM